MGNTKDIQKDNRKMQAVWNNIVLAESNETLLVEGNNYFPPDSVNLEYLEKNNNHTDCPWKGKASYYDVIADGDTNESAAWYYPEPFPAAREIQNYIGFWKGIEVKPAN